MSVSVEIQARIRAFTNELEQLVRQAAIAAVTDSLGGPAASGARPVARASNGHVAASSAPTAPARGRAKSGGKRDPKVIAALVTRVGDYVKAHPGQGVEAIAKALSVSTHDITLPVTKLLAAKAIKKKGQKRATKYFAA